MSQMDGEEKTIDGVTFRVLMLDPLTANDLLVDLLKTLGPALGSLANSLLSAEDSGAAIKQLLDGDNPIEKLDLEQAIVNLIDRIEKDKLREIIQKMEKVTSVQKGKDWPQLATVSAVIFRGKLKLMYKWLAFAIKTQFQDFL